MGKSTYKSGFRHGLEGKNDPPEHLIGETLSNETHDYYEGLREDYEAGREAGTIAKEVNDE
jgi:hypothetical protein